MTSTKKYRIRLTTYEQRELEALVPRGRSAAYKQTHARILLVSLARMDETSKQLVKETRAPRPAAPGVPAAYDYEYERNGVSLDRG